MYELGLVRLLRLSSFEPYDPIRPCLWQKSRLRHRRCEGAVRYHEIMQSAFKKPKFRISKSRAKTREVAARNPLVHPSIRATQESGLLGQSERLLLTSVLLGNIQGGGWMTLLASYICLYCKL